MPKSDQTMALAIFLMFGLDWFGFGMVQMTYLRPLLNSTAWGHDFRYPLCHCRPKLAQNKVFALFLVLVWFGEGSNLFKWLIWGSHWIPQLENLLVDTQHLTIGQNLAKTMVLAIFLVLAWFCFVLAIILVQILKALAKTVPSIPHTPQMDLKCLIYQLGDVNINTLVL